MDNLIALHEELVSKTYQHSPYSAFNISDPKPRNIHKALVRDRLLHHAICRVLYSFNVYMNEFDQFVKHKLKARYYIRYADDFVFFSNNKEHLAHISHGVNMFLRDKLKLELHPDKVFIKTLSSGVDFLGWVHFLKHRVLRTMTKRRMIKNFSEKSASSYLGMLKHGNTYKLESVVNLKQ